MQKLLDKNTNMKSKFRFLVLLTFFINTFLTFAQKTVLPPPPPDGTNYANRAPTPGARPSPIDDYLFLLIPIAVMFIIYFAKKYKKQLN